VNVALGASPGVIVRALHYAYGLGMDSVGIAQELGGHITAVWVRQTLFRAQRCYQRLQAAKAQEARVEC
jgi:hypothetical protein